ncbi:MAG: hypothetical protein P3A28_00850 [Gemmatimonadota bacterium]|nr:hypothetical protein [Gemmatimonadota bacterium]
MNNKQRHTITRLGTFAILFVCATTAGIAQSPGSLRSYAPAEPDRIAIQAVVDSALTFITSSDAIGLTDLMLPEAQTYSSRQREGRWAYAMRTRDADRARTRGAQVVERGWATEIRISGPIAIVWLPYDIYVNNAWSHCGVDVLTMIRVETAWRIANFTYSVEQPPACVPHPSGPPPGMKAP